MVCGNCKSVAKVPLFCNSCYQNAKLKARKEGAITLADELFRIMQYWDNKGLEYYYDKGNKVTCVSLIKEHLKEFRDRKLFDGGKKWQ